MSKHNEEKAVRGLTIKFQGKNIVVTKDIMQSLAGCVLIALSFIMSGFFAFVSVGFDVSRLLTPAFWLSYLITLLTMYIGFFGVYVIREGRNKRQPKVVINNRQRRDFRDNIISNGKLESCENWLKIYNYAKRIEIHKDNLTESYRKLKLAPPDKSLDKNSRKYKRQERKYNEACDKRDAIKKQLEYTNLHEQIIAKLKLNDKAGADEIRKQIGEDDLFKCAKIIWREIYFNDLFNGSMRHNSNTIFYSKSKAIWDNIKLGLLFSVLGTAITTSMLLGPNEVNIYTILTIITNLAMLCCYTVMGIRVADNVIFETVYPADENKLMICNLFKEDDEKINAKWVDIDEEEPEPEDEEAENEEKSVETDT